MTLPDSLLAAFKAQFGIPPSHGAMAPGRINMLGEHVDYNHGWVLPAAVDRAVYFAASRANHHSWYAQDLEEEHQPILLNQPGECGWANYLLGVIDAFERRGIPVPPLSLAFTSTIPMGAGLSSSAALCSGFALLLQEFCGTTFSRKELAFIAQESEHRFAGVHCGLMDQYASLHGVADCILLLDCLTNTHTVVPAHLPGHTWLVVNSGVKHAHAEGAYNARRAAAEAAFAALRAAAPELSTWRDVRPMDLERLREAPEVQQRAARFIVGELRRSQEAVEALKAGDSKRIGDLLVETHAGLRDDYAVSCTEMDALVDDALGHEGVLGARQMGGGFGGCALILVQEKQVNALERDFRGKFPEVYRFTLVDGAHAAPLAPEFNVFEHPHRRYNPLLDEWILVSPQRNKRPWQGAVESPVNHAVEQHDPDCYLCAGVTRQGGETNPEYRGVYVFDNDFPAFGAGGTAPRHPDEGFFQAKPERGINRVVCFSDRHDVSYSELSDAERLAVFQTWQGQSKALGERQDIHYVQIFENKGAAMGCSNPHPHGQIWAQDSVPSQVARTQTNLLAYFEKNGRCLLSDYAQEESLSKERVLFENEHLMALVPYWATWPFETLLVQKRPCKQIEDATPQEAEAWAMALGRISGLRSPFWGFISLFGRFSSSSA